MRNINPPGGLSIRLATEADIPAMHKLMDVAIAELLKPFLGAAEVKASFEIMGIDTQLIKDQTYFAVEEAGVIIGCGGWSRRATLYGGDHTDGRDAAMLNRGADAARVRAMYTHPDHTRRGIGRLVLETCEDAARRQGFTRVELAATMAGVPLYAACGYEPIEEMMSQTSTGVDVPLIRMGKPV